MKLLARDGFVHTRWYGELLLCLACYNMISTPTSTISPPARPNVAAASSILEAETSCVCSYHVAHL